MRSSEVTKNADNGGKKPTLLILLVVFIVVAIAGIVVDFVLDKNGVIAFISLLAVFLLISGFLIFEVIRRRKSKNEMSNAVKSDDQRFLRHVSSPDGGFEDDYQSSAWGGEVISSRRSVETSFEDDEEDENDYRRAFSQNTYSKRVFESNDESEEIEDITSGFEDDEDMDLDLPEEEPEFVMPRKREPEYMSMPASQAPPRRSFLFGKKTPEEETVQIIEENIPSRVSEPEPVAQPEPIERPFANYRRTREEPQENEFTAPEPEHEEFKPVELPQPQKKQPAAPAASAPAHTAVKSAPMGFVEGQSLESFYSQMSEEDILYKDCVEVWAAAAKPCVLRMMKYIEGIEDKRTASLFGRECEYINAMLDRIYYFTEMDDIQNQLELRRFNFSTLVMECLKRFSPFFTERKLGLLWKGLDIEVVTDRRWFVFALTQIVFNCVEFTPQGGKIAISARKSGDFVELCIDDSGCGIKSEELPFVFMAGFMSDDAPNPENTRTGMGLFIARNVVRKMGGDVFAESNPGKGTRIIMRMPTNIR